MKIEQSSMKMVGKVAAAIALGAGASAQFAGNGNHEVVVGRPVFEVSLENDIHTPQPARGKIVLSRGEERELQLSLRMRPFAGIDPLAIVPSLEEMDKAVILSEGTPGGMAVIHLDTRAPELRGAGGVRIVGQFDDDGVFEVDLPSDMPLRGFFAWGEEYLGWDLVRVPAAGSAARTSKRPSTESMDLAQAAHQAYSSWVFYWTDLQLRADARARGFEIEAQSASLLAVASGAVGTQVARGKIELERPRTPQLGGGHAQQQSGGVDAGGAEAPVIPPTVDLEDPQDPKGGLRGGNRIELRRPSHRDNNVLRR